VLGKLLEGGETLASAGLRSMTVYAGGPTTLQASQAPSENLSHLTKKHTFEFRIGKRCFSSTDTEDQDAMSILTGPKGFKEEVAKGMVSALETSFGKGKVNGQVLNSFGDAGTSE
jgi:hypothetical protein